MLSDPRAGMHGSRAFVRVAEPLRRIIRQARGPDERDSGIQMRPEILPQDADIQRLAWPLGPRMGMRIDQSRQDPALGNEFGTGHRIRCPSITVGIEIDRLAFRKSETPDS
ncbi:hypothetical protein GCM10010112_65160 [Actinoplanes lobatus]|uniref:Uncharacterized protein n=1 Tax=Actinoplanes lobatus TaxID=113568 RepID=A0ABQ4AWI4_9ACTN|nr:hypothetical protein GCM10010112_65160 [Actinoplanes lobatus]GIE45337.1 hypothetical protein Alo02nite_82350 [Actinoplanes lobatus]